MLKMNEEERVPEKRSVVLMLFLSIITLGIYPSIWYIRRVSEFNGLHTEKKLNLGLSVIFLFIIISGLIVLPLSILLTPFGVYLENPVLNFFSILPQEFTLIIQAVVYLILVLLYLSLAFRARTIINEALARKGIQRKISGFFTLIFNLFYLQYEVNRIMTDKEESKRIAPWILFILALIALIGLGIYLYLAYQTLFIPVILG